jgi:FtsZ-binding cell division protein ZapB
VSYTLSVHNAAQTAAALQAEIQRLKAEMQLNNQAINERVMAENMQLKEQLQRQNELWQVRRSPCTHPSLMCAANTGDDDEYGEAVGFANVLPV